MSVSFTRYFFPPWFAWPFSGAFLLVFSQQKGGTGIWRGSVMCQALFYAIYIYAVCVLTVTLWEGLVFPFSRGNPWDFEGYVIFSRSYRTQQVTLGFEPRCYSRTSPKPSDQLSILGGGPPVGATQKWPYVAARAELVSLTCCCSRISFLLFRDLRPQ